MIPGYRACRNPPSNGCLFISKTKKKGAEAPISSLVVSIGIYAS